MLAFNDQRDLEANARAMEAATHHVMTGEITTATRAIEYNGVKVEEGHMIGLLNDELTAANETDRRNVLDAARSDGRGAIWKL